MRIRSNSVCQEALLAPHSGQNTPSKQRSQCEFSIWPDKEMGSNELVVKTQLMKACSRYDGINNLFHIAGIANMITNETYDAVFRKSGEGFNIVEIPLMYRINRIRWFAYISYANHKACLLLISQGQNRIEARQRAKRWINYCTRASEHGEPVVVNEAGDTIN